VVCVAAVLERKKNFLSSYSFGGLSSSSGGGGIITIFFFFFQKRI
jgi:hypothetical protein